jgi:hypothetical protein
VEVKQTFINFLITHHKLGSSRVTPNCLGGFTFKSNKYHEDCFTKFKYLQRGSHSTLSLDFSQITQTSLRGKGERFQRLKDVYFCWWNQQPPNEGGKSFYTCPPKTSHWKLASTNRNIWNLKYTHYRNKRTLQFGKLDYLIFPDSVRCVVYEAIVFHLSHLSF